MLRFVSTHGEQVWVQVLVMVWVLFLKLDIWQVIDKLVGSGGGGEGGGGGGDWFGYMIWVVGLIFFNNYFFLTGGLLWQVDK